MSHGAKDAAWNAWWGTLSSAKAEACEGHSSNPVFRAIRKNFNTLGSGKRDYIEGLQAERIATYSPYTDSGTHLTGLHYKEEDPFKVDLSSVAAAHNSNSLFNTDSIASPVSQSVTVDNATGVTTLNTAVYGEAPAPEMGKSFCQIGLGIADSIMDQFTCIQDANSYSPAGYASKGYGTEGIFGSKSTSSERRDMWGREIKTEGIQDYVEDGARRYNIDFAGNYTEVNALTGQPLETAGGMNGFYQSAGWDSSQGMWNTTTVSNVYGTASVADSTNIWGTPSGVASTSESLNNMYGTLGWNGEGWSSATIADLYGTSAATSTDNNSANTQSNSTNTTTADSNSSWFFNQA